MHENTGSPKMVAIKNGKKPQNPHFMDIFKYLVSKKNT